MLEGWGLGMMCMGAAGLYRSPVCSSTVMLWFHPFRSSAGMCYTVTVQCLMCSHAPAQSGCCFLMMSCAECPRGSSVGGGGVHVSVLFMRCLVVAVHSCCAMPCVICVDARPPLRSPCNTAMHDKPGNTHALARTGTGNDNASNKSR